MAWSTREVAELAGTTVNAVRHYHRAGLLAMPSRASNGYKLYEVDHLVRLLRIKRLTDMGLPLAHIDVLDDAATRADALRALDAELAADIDRLVRVRAEVALVLSARSATDLPSGFAADPGNLTESDRTLMLIYSKLFAPREMGIMQELMTAEREPADNELDALPADADDETRQQLAERLVPIIRGLAPKDEWLEKARVPEVTEEVVVRALVHFYNPAQLDVLARAHALAQLNEDPA